MLKLLNPHNYPLPQSPQPPLPPQSPHPPPTPSSSNSSVASDDNAAPTFIDETFNNRYQVLFQIGRGTFSTVWKIYDKKKNKYRALKITNKESHCLTSAQNEIRIMKHLHHSKHKYIVSFYDSFLYSDLLCLVMEEAISNLLVLKNRYKRGLPVKLLERLILQTMEGTHYLHSARVIHTDIKPENILVHAGENFKLCDFGNAYLFGEPIRGELQTRNYRSIENILLLDDCNASMDLWSLGCVYFELATGDYLFNPKGSLEYKVEFNIVEDHIAQIMELMYITQMPTYFQSSRLWDKFFTKQGELLNIKNLNLWDLNSILKEKYWFDSKNALDLSTFLMLLLNLNYKDRISSGKCLDMLKNKN